MMDGEQQDIFLETSEELSLCSCDDGIQLPKKALCWGVNWGLSSNWYRFSIKVEREMTQNPEEEMNSSNLSPYPK